jgi:hypothetical protein
LKWPLFRFAGSLCRRQGRARYIQRLCLCVRLCLLRVPVPLPGLPAACSAVVLSSIVALRAARVVPVVLVNARAVRLARILHVLAAVLRLVALLGPGVPCILPARGSPLVVRVGVPAALAARVVPADVLVLERVPVSERVLVRAALREHCRLRVRHRVRRVPAVREAVGVSSTRRAKKAR